MSEKKELESPIAASLAAPTVDIAHHNQSAGDPTRGKAANDLHSRPIVFALLFLVTGALGIPLLWMSPNFSKTERIIWSIVVTIYTVILLVIAGAIVMWSWRQIFG